ncbi:hypothetical protein RIF29_18812 [Crotalaria pallida]|uniref:Uncharacterized protein n=1 Tax=Crotalaria pallida TaxID=3830 RepID=A0AAN9I758_CROPI
MEELEWTPANSHGGSGTFHIKAVRVQPDPKPLHNMLKLSMVGKRYVVMGASYETEIELVGESFSKMDDMWSLLMEDMLKESGWEAVIEVMLKRGNNFVLKSLFFSQATVQHKPSMKQVLQMLSKEVHVREEALTKSRIYRWHSSGKICWKN